MVVWALVVSLLVIMNALDLNEGAYRKEGPFQRQLNPLRVTDCASRIDRALEPRSCERHHSRSLSLCRAIPTHPSCRPTGRISPPPIAPTRVAADTAFMNVFLVEDSPLVCERLVELIEAEGAHRVVGQAATYDDAVAGIASAVPDVGIFDIKLAQGNGI